MTSILSDADRASFISDGWFVVRGLVPRDVALTTRAALFCEIGESPDDPSTWKRVSVLWGNTLVGMPCRVPAIEALAEALVGPDLRRDAANFGLVPVLKYPEPGPEAFVPENGWHIDGAERVTLWPDDCYVIPLVYLSDVPAHGGATAIRPGSHRQVFRHWLTTGAPASTRPPDLPYAAPIAVAGEAGDVILMHYLTVHSGSHNRSSRIRVALNTAIQPDPQRPYVRKRGAPTADWSPLDWTLRSDDLPEPARTP